VLFEQLLGVASELVGLGHRCQGLLSEGYHEDRGRFASAADLRIRRRDSGGRAERWILDKQEAVRPATPLMHRDPVVAMDVRHRAASRELRVFGASESHRARPCRTTDLRLCSDPEDLDRAVTPGGRDHGRLEPPLGSLDDCRGKGVFGKPHRARLGVEQVEAEAWPLRIGERRSVGADLGLIEAAARERIHRRQFDAAMNRMRDPE
jgi:hypothetical protein